MAKAKKKIKKKEGEIGKGKKAAGKIKAVFIGEKVTSNSSFAYQLYDQSRFGEVVEKKISYSFVEALYLMKKEKLEVFFNKKKLSEARFIEEARKKEPNFMTRYAVFSALRNRGYIVKTALKFGADFRVYERGVKPGEKHAKWIVFPVYESAGLTWHEFAAKNRVAHSTRKNLLIAIVDDEGDVTFYEVRWIRP